MKRGSDHPFGCHGEVSPLCGFQSNDPHCGCCGSFRNGLCLPGEHSDAQPDFGAGLFVDALWHFSAAASPQQLTDWKYSSGHVIPKNRKTYVSLLKV